MSGRKNTSLEEPPPESRRTSTRKTKCKSKTKSEKVLNSHQIKVLETIERNKYKSKRPLTVESGQDHPAPSTSGAGPPKRSRVRHRKRRKPPGPKKNASPCEDMEWDSIVQEVNTHWKSENVAVSADFAHVVVDSNIFLSHLNLIEDLVRKKLDNNSVIVVPWRVVQELDGLKRNAELNSAARRVLNFFRENLKNNRRITGQSLKEANDYLYPCQCPDDEILNCCLQLSRSLKTTVLLSDDINLCTKATLNDIRAYTYNEFVDNFLNTKRISETAPNTKQKEAEEFTIIYEKIESTLRDFLKKVLEKRMKEIYEDLWLDVVFIKPPWTVNNILDCIHKHWIAVFSETLPKYTQEMVKSLKFHFPKRKKVTISSWDEINVLVSGCNKLLNCFKAREEYKYDAMSCSQKINDLAMIKTGSIQETDTIMSNQCSNNASEGSSERNRNQIVPKDCISNAFLFIWNGFTNYCSQLASSLGVSHCLNHDPNQIIPLTQLIEQADKVKNQLDLLVGALSSILVSFPIDQGSPEYKKLKANMAIEELITCLNSTVVGMGQQGIGFDSSQLAAYCIGNRDVLEDGFNKFKMLQNLIIECSDQYCKMKFQ